MLCFCTTLKPLRIAHKYMHPMFGVLFILALRLEDELLEDVVIPRDNAVIRNILRRLCVLPGNNRTNLILSEQSLP